jgi:membrane protease YdiL (CAAX protease family)
MQTTATNDRNSAAWRRARRGRAIYFAVVVALSAPIQAMMINSGLDGGTNDPVQWFLLIFGLMLAATIASLAARLVLQEGFSDVSFRLGGHRGRNAILQALVFPLAVGLISYSTARAAGLVEVELPPLTQWVVSLAVALSVSVFLVSGEEIGWRGYTLTHLIDAGVPRPLLASGLIWGLWHVPLVLWAGYAAAPSPLLSIALLMLATTSLAYMLARIRLETGSVWPAIALHAVWNAIIQTGFDPVTTGSQKALWVGETGVLTVLVLTVAAILHSRERSTSPEVSYAYTR